MRKHDLIRLCEAHPNCSFLCFTNATLIDEDFCQDLLRVGNFVPAISAEDSREATDARRGAGTYDKVAATRHAICPPCTTREPHTPATPRRQRPTAGTTQGREDAPPRQ